MGAGAADEKAADRCTQITLNEYLGLAERLCCSEGRGRGRSFSGLEYDHIGVGNAVDDTTFAIIIYG